MKKIFSEDELRSLKTQYNKAKELLEHINALTLRYDAAFKAVETRIIDIDRTAEEVRSKSVFVETARVESANLVTEIKGNLEKIALNISQIEEAAIRFEGIKGRVEGKESEIELLLSAARGLKEDIEKEKLAAQNKLSEINAQFAEAQDKVAQVRKAFEDFITIKTKIDDPTSGLQAVLNQSIELGQQSAKTFSEIQAFHSEAIRYFEEIKLTQSDISKIRDQATEGLAAINTNKGEVQKITNLITDTGFANSFQKRERMLRWGAFIWLVVLGISVAILADKLASFFPNIENVPEWRVIAYRLTLTSPWLFLIGFAMRQYGNERSLNERYAFKATIAAVIRNHSDFLNEITNKGSEQNTTFVRDVLEDLYLAPYENGMNIKEVQEQIKAVMKEENDKSGLSFVLAKAKELKELIPDELTYRNVVGLFKH